MIPIHTRAPEAWWGAERVVGIVARKGARKYEKGKKVRERRKDRKVPRRKERRGKRRSWRVMPIRPRIARAAPMEGGGSARPPVKVKGSLGR